MRTLLNIYLAESLSQQCTKMQTYQLALCQDGGRIFDLQNGRSYSSRPVISVDRVRNSHVFADFDPAYSLRLSSDPSHDRVRYFARAPLSDLSKRSNDTVECWIDT